MNHTDLTIKTYNKIAETYANTYYGDNLDLPYIDTFLSYLPAEPKILDVGCGSGRFTPYFLSKNCKVEGIDLSEKMIEVATKRVPESVFKHMDMRTLDYPDNTFDGLFLGYSLIHIPSKEVETTLEEQHRVLKDGGIILIIAQKGYSDHIAPAPANEDERLFFNFFTLDQLVYHLKQTNFEIVYQNAEVFKDPESYTEGVNYVIGKKISTPSS